MKPKRPIKSKALPPVKRGFDGLLRDLRGIITESRRQVLRAVDVVQVRTCWGVGRHIVEFEQRGTARAEYGAKLLPRLAERLTEEFGRGFDERNLFYMRRFYLAFPILNAVRSELSWTHYRTLLRVEDVAAREWYANEAVAQNWSSRALERQVGRLYYERLLSSKDRKAVRAEAAKKIAELPPSPREFVRDPVLLEFLGLPETGRPLESDMEQRLIDHLQSFLLELGKGGTGTIAVDGKTDGDFQTLEWTTSGKGARLGLIVHHTDAAREFAYGRESHVGRLARGLDEAPKRGWTIVDMKDDRKTVFPAEKK
jgi:predicted nuclease of restriction endonuclease-like (RecB) superfamily